jgi:uncharacterized protein with von Willebrand factor type A (vWA) domain
MADKDNEIKDGSLPSNTETDVEAESSTAKDVKEDSSTEQPWHKDKRFKDDLDSLKLGKSVKGLLEANGLEDVEELKDLVESGSKIRGKKVDLENLDDILAKAEKLTQYEKYWQQQAELQRRGAETPEQTVQRLTKALEEREQKESLKEQQEREAKEAKQSISSYEKEVSSQLDVMEDLTPDAKQFLAWSLGVGNECNEIDLKDKKAVRKLTTDGVKKFNDLVKTYKDLGVKEYLEGKKSIPNVPSTSGTVATSEKEPIRGLKNLRKALHESVFNKGG